MKRDKKKYFIVSDVHGFYDELIEGLDNAGFDLSNPSHIFVSLGDLFDRGDKCYECLQFVNSLPEDRKILIRGNHEDLITEAMQRGYFDHKDHHNQTDKTCWEFYSRFNIIDEEVNDIDVLEWLRSFDELHTYLDSTKYYEIVKNNLFLHGWVPYWCQTLRAIKNTNAEDWYDSTWSDGSIYCIHYNRKIKTSNRKGSKLVTVFCGHVHSCILNNKYHNSGEIIVDQLGNVDVSKLDNNIFIDEGIVNLDSFTVVSKKVNVYVLEE